MKKLIKKIMMKKVAVAIMCIVSVLFFTISGCEQKSDLNETSNILRGKWQLKSVHSLNAEGVSYMLVDFTTYNIIYEFKANNVLTVSGNDGSIDHGGLEMGKHFYKVTLTNISNGSLVTELPQHLVEINTIPYCFCVGYMSDDSALFLSHGENNSQFVFVRK